MTNESNFLHGKSYYQGVLEVSDMTAATANLISPFEYPKLTLIFEAINICWESENQS